jgi:nicotinamidase-related amidase
MPSKALLVIDMQNDLCHDLRRSQKVMSIINILLETIELFAAHGYPVYYACFSLPETDEQFRRFGDKYCIEGTKGAEIISELLPLRGVIVEKRKHSAFFETTLDDLLKESKVREIYLTGMQTQICIMTTAADAYFRGYRSVVISDCVISTNEENKINALHWIEKYVGEVMSLNDIKVRENLLSSRDQRSLSS